MAQLKVEGLTVSLNGAPVVSGVTFTLGPGQRVGLIGEAGAGKSFVALAVLGLLRPGAKASGAISLDDAALPVADDERAALRGKRIGAILQDGGNGFDPLRTVGSLIGDALRQAGETGDIDKQVAAVLGEIGLDPTIAGRHPSELSAAQRQLAMVATVLAAKPELLVADEPTAGLDLLGRRRVVDLLERHCSERSMGLLLISHDLKAVALLCTRVVVIKAGVAVESGDKQEVFGHPKHDYTRALMSAGRHRAKTLMRAPIGGVLLDVRHVSRRFRTDAGPFSRGEPVPALDDLNLSLRIGESLALIGPSSAGKSTLLKIIAGLDRAGGGELEFDHEVYHGTDLPLRVRRDITLVTSDPLRAFNPRLTVGESIAEPLRLEALRPMEELSARIIEVINAVGLSAEALRRYPREFTAGERQRMAIARALMTRPRLMLLDDPVGALDVSSRGEVLVLLNRLRADFGVTFLVATQDLDVVRIVADRVAVMDKGKVTEIGTPAQLLEKPQQAVTQQLIAAALPDVGIVPVF